MAKLSEHKQSQKSTILAIGNNGTGKTGSLASLAKAGYKIRVIDCDNGVEILKNLLRGDEAALDRVDVETHMDIYGGANGNPLPKLPLKGFSGVAKTLDNWPGLGKPSEWGTDTVLVLDSLTLLGRFIMNHVLSLNVHLGKPPQLQHWGAAMSLQEDIISMITGDTFKCHVIVMAHITTIDSENEIGKVGYPSALGSKLPPKIGSYFNTTLHYDREGSGQSMRRIIRTQPKGSVECKTSAPGIVPATLPLETGLADYFKALHGPLKQD